NKNDPMQRWWHNPINRNDPESEISSILTPSKKNTIIKHQYNVFIGTNLESKLKKHNIEQLVIVGVMTHLCCETTARDAFMRGYNVIFTIDGTASYREDFHLGTLRAISHGFGACFLIDDLLGEKIHEIYP
ncbi:MAG: isochorismatase family protein, partial [Promethearchaeota archaeon]